MPIEGDFIDASAVVKTRSLFTEQEIRDGLVVLREEKLSIDFPETDQETGFLRDEMIDTLVIVKPTNREEFLQLVPPNVRQKTKPSEAAQYLDKALEIISGDVPA